MTKLQEIKQYLFYFFRSTLREKVSRYVHSKVLSTISPCYCFTKFFKPYVQIMDQFTVTITTPQVKSEIYMKAIIGNTLALLLFRKSVFCPRKFRFRVRIISVSAKNFVNVSEFPYMILLGV